MGRDYEWEGTTSGKGLRVIETEVFLATGTIDIIPVTIDNETLQVTLVTGTICIVPVAMDNHSSHVTNALSDGHYRFRARC